MKRKLPYHYFYGTPTSMRSSLIMAAGMGELLGQLIALPFKTPFYVAAFVKQLRSNPIIQESISLSPSKKSGELEKNIRKSLYELKHRSLIVYHRNKDGTIELLLTSKGKIEYKKIRLRTLQISPPSQWDGKWRMIIFDIPEKQRALRDLLRQKLKQINFFQIQQSVWVHPFECEGEVRFLSQFYNVDACVLFYKITIENDRELRKYFKL